VVEPTIYLLAFGFGFGSLVAQVAGYDYIDFVGTGIVATAVLFGSAFPGMFGTFIKRVYQKTYDAVLAAPVDTDELVTAEALWLAVRAGGLASCRCWSPSPSASSRPGGCCSSRWSACSPGSASRCSASGCRASCRRSTPSATSSRRC
jgi:hypothetical protein